MTLQEIQQLITSRSQAEKLQMIQFLATDVLRGSSPEFAPQTAIFPPELQRKICDHLAALPNMYGVQFQRALLMSTPVDPSLIQRIPLGVPPVQFAEAVVNVLSSAGKLADGRHALEAVLETSKQYLGVDGQYRCDMLIQAISTARLSFEQGET